MEDLKSSGITLRILKEIWIGNTGSRSDFAKRIGISPRRLTAHKRKIEEIMGYKIKFSKKLNSYLLDESSPPLVFRIILNYSLY